MKKKFFCALIVLAMVLTLCGCSMTYNLTFDKEGNVSGYSALFVKEEDVINYDEYLSSDETVIVTKKTINGVAYRIYTDILSEEDTVTGIFGGSTYNSDYFYGDISLTEKELSLFAKDNGILAFNITFPYKVTKTNGTILEDGKTVNWIFDLNQLTKTLDNPENIYVIFNKKAITSSIKYTGVSDGKFYNKAKTVTLKYTAPLDSKSYTFKSKTSSTTVNYFYDIFKVGSEGKHTFSVTDITGKKKSVSFTIDLTKPVISGVKNGGTYKKEVTIKCSDNYGVSSIILNDKEITNKTKISKEGSYTLVVKDKAGNSSKIKFEITK